MSEKIVQLDERVQPAFITDNDTGDRYELDFSRESVKFAEARGFVLDDVPKFLVTGTEDLFFYSFRKKHKTVARDKTDKLLHKMGGMTPKLMNRLILLYQQAITAHVIQDEDDLEKNEHVTLEL